MPLGALLVEFYVYRAAKMNSSPLHMSSTSYNTRSNDIPFTIKNLSQLFTTSRNGGATLNKLSGSMFSPAINPSFNPRHKPFSCAYRQNGWSFYATLILSSNVTLEEYAHVQWFLLTLCALSSGDDGLELDWPIIYNYSLDQDLPPSTPP